MSHLKNRQSVPLILKGNLTLTYFLRSKYVCKDQESIQSSTTPDPGYQWESDKLTADTTNERQEVSPFALLWLCFKLPSFLFGNIKNTSVMHDIAKCVCFICMQPQEVKFKFVQINMKQVSYSRPYLGSVNLTKHDLKEFYGNMR